MPLRSVIAIAVQGIAARIPERTQVPTIESVHLLSRIQAIQVPSVRGIKTMKIVTHGGAFVLLFFAARFLQLTSSQGISTFAFSRKLNFGG